MGGPDGGAPAPNGGGGQLIPGASGLYGSPAKTFHLKKKLIKTRMRMNVPGGGRLGGGALRWGGGGRDPTFTGGTTGGAPGGGRL